MSSFDLCELLLGILLSFFVYSVLVRMEQTTHLSVSIVDFF